MNKNYYDILQVNKNASPEIIEKAYKTLAKKYHPDLQAEENKKQAEEILKEINEAYEVLSDLEKKQNYDKHLIEQEENNSSAPQKNDPFSNTSTEDMQHTKEELLKQQLQYQEQLKREQEIAYQQQLQQARQKAYYDAYIQDLKNRGYRIRYQKSLKDYIRGLITIIIVILVLFLLWQVPPIQNFFINLCQNNPILQTIINFFSNRTT